MTTTISNTADLATWLDDTRPDSQSYRAATIDQIQASDHPPWGADWETWLATEVPALLAEVVHAVDALPPGDQIVQYLQSHGAMSARDIVSDLDVTEADIDRVHLDGQIRYADVPHGGISPWYEATDR